MARIPNSSQEAKRERQRRRLELAKLNAVTRVYFATVIEQSSAGRQRTIGSHEEDRQPGLCAPRNYLAVTLPV